MLAGGTVVLLRDGADGPEALMIRRPDRGSFAGAWVFPGGVTEEADAGDTEQETAERAAVRECEEEVGLRPSRLRPLSLWLPPAEAPKRVRTWFFLAAAHDGELRLAPDEVKEALWATPAEALRRHGNGEIPLFPPTWVTLHELAGYASVAAAMDEASEPERYATHLVGDGVFAWRGDVEHPEGGSGRHRLVTAGLPWGYVRD